MSTGGSSSNHQASDFSLSQNQASDFSSTLHQGSDFSTTLYQGSDLGSSIHKGSAKIDTAEQCQNHKDHKLDLFCEDHDVLICSRCLISSHKKCTEHLVLIDDKVKKMQQTGDFTKLTKKINALKQELNQKKIGFEGNVEQLKKAFEEQLDKINTLRKKLNETLDQLERNTSKELNTLLETLKAPLQDDMDKCIDALSRIQNIQDEIQNIDKNTETLKLILYKKCSKTLSEIQSFKSKWFPTMPTIKLIPDSSIARILSLSSFGKLINPNEILKVTGNTKYNIAKWLPYYVCCIGHICETDSGELLIADINNGEVKLLDKDYKMVTYYKLPTKLRSMCSIGASVVAVALDNKEIYIIRVTNVGQLVLDRKMKLERDCRHIFHHQGNFYITSDSALYDYTVCGTLVSKIYEDLSTRSKVTACAISPDGTNLYVGYEMQLVTLSSDGTVINKVAIFHNEYGRYIYHGLNLHVTDSGQVIVSCFNSNKILQLDSDGRRILAEVATRKDGVESPMSVYYSKRRASLIVGLGSDNILVFKT